MNRFVIAEPDKCIGCRTCEVACALAHPIGTGTGEALSPANFRPRLKLVKGLRGRGRDVSYLTPPAQIRTCRTTAYGSCQRS